MQSQMKVVMFEHYESAVKLDKPATACVAFAGVHFAQGAPRIWAIVLAQSAAGLFVLGQLA